MRKRNLIGAAAFSLALAGGGVAGALLGTPGTSGAQDGTTTTEQPATTDATAPVHGPGQHGRGPGLKAAADALGITPEELRTELEAGKSIAQIAEAKGIDKQVVIDAIVKEGTDRLNEEIAKLPERASALVDREGLPARPEGGPRGDHAPDDAAADAPADTSTTTAS